MKVIINRIINLFFNISTMIYTFIKKRDKKTILLGAWMGTKFADNSRYLFQFLSKNKDKLKLNNVVWVTRNEQVMKELREKGYTVCLGGTRESRQWHLKAGVHIICNYSVPAGTYLADIDSQYSWGAKKVQLWHGVGMKSIGVIANSYKKNGFLISKILNNKFISTITYSGGWNNPWFLSTSELNMKVNKAFTGRDDNAFFISSYPRFCDCLEMLNEETSVINELEKHKGVILYLPTFRSDYGGYKHPLDDIALCDFLERNDYVWVEKQHTVSNYKRENKLKNVIELHKTFDINVLYDVATVVVSDYSSVVFDAVIKEKPVVMYVPDIDMFRTGEVGLLFDLEDYCGELLANSTEKCLWIFNEVIKKLYFTDKRKEIYANIQLDFFGNRKADFWSIWEEIENLK